MDKVIRDGKVAVLYSGDYGAAWYNSHQCKELVFYPKIVELVEQNRRNEITEELVADILGIDEDDCPSISGRQDLTIEWVEVGTKFRIQQYDGTEWVVRYEEDDWFYI